MSDVANKDTNCLFDIILDEDTIRRNTPDIDHEREVAIFDLLEENYFELAPREGKPTITGPFILTLSLIENRLLFQIRLSLMCAHTQWLNRECPRSSFRSLSSARAQNSKATFAGIMIKDSNICC